jgi:hypothetical protein
VLEGYAETHASIILVLPITTGSMCPVQRSCKMFIPMRAWMGRDDGSRMRYVQVSCVEQSA